MAAQARHISSVGISLSFCAITLSLNAQQPSVSTHAGTGIEGFVDGDALTQAQFSFPIGVGTCVGNDGTVYIADRGNHAVRKIFNGQVTTLAGNGTQGYADGVGSTAQFAFPNAITVDDTNNVYVADWLNSLIRKITPAGVVTTYAGTPGQNGYQDGPGSTARFFAPFGLTIDTAGNIYVSEANNVIRKIAPDQTVSTFAGQYVFGQGGYLDGSAATARFDRPSGIAFDNAGNLYVAEEGNHTIRKISPSLIVSTVAGINHIGAGPGAGGYIDGDGLTQAEFNTPSGIVVTNDGNIYVADQYNHRIRKITPTGTVATFAGSGPFGTGNGGFAEGPADSARFNQPYSICNDANGNFYIADLNNHRIRKISGLPPVCNLQLSLLITDESCAGAEDGAIDLTVSNGTLPFTFSWSSGQTTEDIANLPAGGYSVIITDNNNCTTIGTVAVSAIPPDSTTAANLPPPCTELFISEYTEGQAHNRAIEIYNPSNDTMALNRYFLRVFMNGAPTPLIAQLVGVLLPHKTHVITHPNASSPIYSLAQQTSNKLTFDGDDALQLIKVKNTFIPNVDSIEGIGGNPHAIFDTLALDTLDQLGIPYIDPGNQGFSVISGTTKNSTLIRNASVTYGNTDWGCGQKQWRVMPQDSVFNLGKHQNICIAAPIVYLRFRNPSQTTDTITGNKYFNFDLEVKASDTTNNLYFNLMQIFINYDSLSFGSNAIVSIKRGSLILDSATYNSIYVVKGTNTATGKKYFRTNISVVNPNPSPNRIKLPLTFVPLVHYSIKIINCNYNSGLSFDTTFTGFDYLIWVDTATQKPTTNVGDGAYGGPVYLNDMDSLTLCELNIFDFTSPVYPGTYYPGTTDTKWLMEIQGIGFGSTRENGNVWFMNAHTPYNSDYRIKYTPLNSYDFISWGDSLIKIKMPSNIDTTIVVNEPTRIPGSGKFYIKTNIGDSVMSDIPVDMPYAIENGIDTPLATGGKTRFDLVNINPTDSFTIVFYLDTSITNHPNPMVKNIVKKAIHDLNCGTKAWVIVGGDTALGTSLPLLPNDNVSLISFVDYFPGEPQKLAQMAPRAGACGDIAGDKHAFYVETDVHIKRTPSGGPWFFDTLSTTLPAGMYDFYEVVLHELLHAVLLKHSLAPDSSLNSGELMYFTPVFNVSASSPRRLLDGSDAQSGVIDAAQKGALANLNTSSCQSANIGTLILAPDCSIEGIKEEFSSGPNIMIFPNPSKESFYAKFFTSADRMDVLLHVYDYAGKLVNAFEFKKLRVGNHTVEINMQPFPAGMYFVRINTNNKNYFLKLIKF